MDPVCSHNFSGIFRLFENRLNSHFQGNTKILEGGDVRSPRNSIYYRYRKRIVSKSDTDKEHFQPHINVYVDDKELKNIMDEGFHILSHKYHPFEIFNMIERYLVK